MNFIKHTGLAAFILAALTISCGGNSGEQKPAPIHVDTNSTEIIISEEPGPKLGTEKEIFDSEVRASKQANEGQEDSIK